MTRSLELFLRKADAFDTDLSDETGEGILRGLYATVELEKLSKKMPETDPQAAAALVPKCTGPGRQLLVLAWARQAPDQLGTDFLAACLERGARSVQLRVAGALAREGSDVSRKLLEKALLIATHAELRDALKVALSHFSYPIVPSWVRESFAAEADLGPAIDALAKIDNPESNELLLQALASKKKWWSDAALAALTDRQDPRIGDALVALLAKGSAQCKKQAVRLLGARRDQMAGLVLADVASKAKARDLRMVAALALGKLESTAHLPTLVEILNKPGEDILVTTAACLSIGRIGGADAFEPLRDVVEGRSHGEGTAPMPIQKNIYRAAIDGVSHLDDPRTIPFLLTRLESEEEWDRAEAARCLARLKAVEALDHVERSAARPCVYRDSAALLGKSAERLRAARERAEATRGRKGKARA